MDILVVDDQEAVCVALQVLFEVEGLSCRTTTDPEEALDLIAREAIGVVIQDMNFTQARSSGEEGAALFHRIRELDPDMPVILITAWSSVERAVELIRQGAADYMPKPWEDDKLLMRVRSLLQMRQFQLENTRLRARSARARAGLRRDYDLRGLIYASDAMHELASLAVRVARADVPVLITGSNGTGKEIMAEIVHANSSRRDKPLIKVNAGALPDDLMEAELFGAEAGAFTGAVKRAGRFEAAHGGTLFLDELGNLSAAGQRKLLRVLQSGEFERLGSNETRRVDVRVISATNAELGSAIQAGAFRQDLYYRLNVIELRLPDLADRPEDILPLAEHFLASFAQPGQSPWTLSPDAERLLESHGWPGNVRELRNCIQRATLISAGPGLAPADLGLQPSGVAPPEASPTHARDQHEQQERREVLEALARNKDVISRAAAELGLSRQSLYRKMDRLGITLSRSR